MTIDELRSFVLGLDEASQSSHQGSPDFRYRNRIAVNLDLDERSITIKLPLHEQAAEMERGDGARLLRSRSTSSGWERWKTTG